MTELKNEGVNATVLNHLSEQRVFLLIRMNTSIHHLNRRTLTRGKPCEEQANSTQKEPSATPAGNQAEDILAARQQH